MDITQVRNELITTYSIAIRVRDFYVDNPPNSEKSKIDAKNAADQVEVLSTLYSNELKKQMAVNNNKFDTTIKNLKEYNDKMHGQINDIKTASDIIGFISKVLIVFGITL